MSRRLRLRILIATNLMRIALLRVEVALARLELRLRGDDE